jgi:hypothetical protein
MIGSRSSQKHPAAHGTAQNRPATENLPRTHNVFFVYTWDCYIHGIVKHVVLDIISTCLVISIIRLIISKLSILISIISIIIHMRSLLSDITTWFGTPKQKQEILGRPTMYYPPPSLQRHRLP